MTWTLRVTTTFLLLLNVIACESGGSDAVDGGTSGDLDGGTSDAGRYQCSVYGGEDCFELPAETASVYDALTETDQPADFDCEPDAVEYAEEEITVNGMLVDFSSDDPLAGGTLDAFIDLDFSSPDGTTLSNEDGTYSIVLPAGAPSRMNWRMTVDGSLDTYALNDPVDFTTNPVTDFERSSVSSSTATAISALLIGRPPTAGLGILAGNARDCQGRRVEHVIATISSTSSLADEWPTFVAGAQVYYFESDLPTRRTDASDKDTNSDGMFVVIEIPPTTGEERFYLQVWGFVADEDLALGRSGLSLLSEFAAPVIGDSVISITMSPTQGPL